MLLTSTFTPFDVPLVFLRNFFVSVLGISFMSFVVNMLFGL